MVSVINKQLLLTAHAYLFIMEQQKAQQGGEAIQLLRKTSEETRIENARRLEATFDRHAADAAGFDQELSPDRIREMIFDFDRGTALSNRGFQTPEVKPGFFDAARRKAAQAIVRARIRVCPDNRIDRLIEELEELYVRFGVLGASEGRFKPQFYESISEEKEAKELQTKFGESSWQLQNRHQAVWKEAQKNRSVEKMREIVAEMKSKPAEKTR